MIKSRTINCPHCGFVFGDDDMMRLNFDPWAMARNDDDFECDCPSCKEKIYVTSSWIPNYECYGTESDRGN